jgi:signal transduction histidine kinase/ActR/RegA family two-component response regulator
VIESAQRAWDRVAEHFRRHFRTRRDVFLRHKGAGHRGELLLDDKFLSFATHLPGFVWIKDANGIYQFVNRVTEVVHDRPLAQWIGKSDYDIFAVEAAEQFNRNDREVLSTGAPVLCTEWMPLRGTTLFTMASRFLIRTPGETLIGGVAIDISDGVRAEREIARMRHALVASEPVRSIVELSSTLAHDLNNTLNAVMLRISLFNDPSFDPEQRQNAIKIQRLAADAAASVRRLQEFANSRRPLSTAAIDLGEILCAETRAFHDATNVSPGPTTIKTVLQISPSNLPKVVGNAGEARYVITTLLCNAHEAMPCGGTVTVEASVSQDKVIVTVSDEGTGISEENLPLIFDPFFTTKPNLGSGLGLSGSFGIMARLGGTISAANRPKGGGAIFTLSFPVYKDRGVDLKSERPSPKEARVPGSAKHRVLVVDDDVDNLEAMKEALEARGYEVETALDGKHGLELLRDRPHFDSVICDVGMPLMNGWEVAQGITRAAPTTRVYMLTGWANEIPQSDPRRGRVTEVIAKPTSVEQIDAALARNLET